MTPAARNHWMQLLAVVMTMMAYFGMILMIDKNSKFTPPCLERRLKALIATLITMLLIVYMHYMTLRKSFSILFVITFLTMFTLSGIVHNAKQIMREGPQELDTLDYIIMAIELHLHTFGLFYFILNFLYFLFN